MTDGNMLGEVIDISQPAATQASWMRLGAAEIGAARRFGDHERAWGTGNRVNADRWNIEHCPSRPALGCCGRDFDSTRAVTVAYRTLGVVDYRGGPVA